MKESCFKGCFCSKEENDVNKVVMLNSFQHLHRLKSASKEEIPDQVRDDNRRRGFTLIELLVVVLIIGILAAVAVPQYEKVVAKSRMTEGITLLSSFAQAQKVYFLANGEYTDNLNDLDIGINLNQGYTYSGLGLHSIVNLRRVKDDHIIYTQPIREKIYWRLYYYLDEDKMYCGTEETDERGIALCKSFGGTTSMVCGPSNELVCYEIK